MTTYSLTKRAATALTLLALTSSCSTPTPASVTDTLCEVYRPVCLSRADTEATIDQVMANERVFAELCPVQAAAVRCK